MASDWALLLDLSVETRATELDVLYLDAALRESGTDVLVYPWHPTADVLTPVGAVRPLKVFVPSPALADARELTESVLEGSAQRRDVLVPVADAWTLPYYLPVVILHILDRVRERGGSWRIPYSMLLLYVALQFLFVLFIGVAGRG